MLLETRGMVVKGFLGLQGYSENHEMELGK